MTLAHRKSPKLSIVWDGIEILPSGVHGASGANLDGEARREVLYFHEKLSKTKKKTKTDFLVI